MPYFGNPSFTGLGGRLGQISHTGIRIATEFDTAKHAGTSADPWTRAAIQNGIDDIPASGGLLLAPAGVFSISSPLAGKTLADIAGVGWATVFKLANAVNVNLLNVAGDALIDRTDVHISDIKFDGNKANQSAFTVLLNFQGTRLFVDRCSFLNSFGDGFFAVGENIHISKCYFEGNDDTAIVFSGVNNTGQGLVCTHVSAAHCKFKDNATALNVANDGDWIGFSDNDIETSAKAIELGLTANGTRYSNHVQISRNRIRSTSTTQTPIAGGAAGATAGEDILVEKNTVRGGKWGIHVGGIDVRLIGNRVALAREYGILIDIGTLVLCSLNAVKNCGQSGVNQQGIRVTIADVDVLDNHVFDNQGVPTQDRGIVLAGTSSGCRASGNRVHGNITDQILNLGSNNQVRRNPGHVTENRGAAIILNGTASIVVAHGLIGTPLIAFATGRNLETDECRISARDGTNVTIAVPANVTADRTIDWYAEV